MSNPEKNVEYVEKVEYVWTKQDYEDFIAAHGLGLQLWNEFYAWVDQFCGKVEYVEKEYALVVEQNLERLWRAKLLQTYADKFFNRDDKYALQFTDDAGGIQYAVKTPANKDFIDDKFDLLSRHLLGIHTLSIAAIDAEGKSKWMAWDSDKEDGQLLKIKEGLERLGLHPVRESVREGRDGHLWCFFSRPVSASDLLLFNGELMTQLSITDGSIEFFPKSATKHSQLRAPLGIHKKPGSGMQRGYFEGVPRGQSYWIDAQMSYVAELPLNGSTVVERIAQTAASKPAEIKAKSPHSVRLISSRQFRTESSVDVEDKAEPPNIKDHVKIREKSSGKDLIAACPKCLSRGGDKHGDNLRISKTDATLFNCVHHGPGNGCSNKEVWEVLGYEWCPPHEQYCVMNKCQPSEIKKVNYA